MKFWISVPSSVVLQMYGRRVKRKHCLVVPDRVAQRQAEKPETDLVTYRFVAMPARYAWPFRAPIMTRCW
jgi:hypothetical protein